MARSIHSAEQNEHQGLAKRRQKEQHSNQEQKDNLCYQFQFVRQNAHVGKQVIFPRMTTSVTESSHSGGPVSMTSSSNICDHHSRHHGKRYKVLVWLRWLTSSVVLLLWTTLSPKVQAFPQQRPIWTTAWTASTTSTYKTTRLSMILRPSALFAGATTSSRTKKERAQEEDLVATVLQNETTISSAPLTRQEGDSSSPVSDATALSSTTTATEDEDEDEHDFMIWKVNASDAFGSMLVQMQSTFQQPTTKQEGEQLQQQDQENIHNGTQLPDNRDDKNDPRASEFLLHEDDQDPNKNHDGRASKDVETKNKQGDWVAPATKALLETVSKEEQDKDLSEPSTGPTPLTSMTLEMAKELDDAVVKIPASSSGAEQNELMLLDEELMELPSIYQSKKKAKKDEHQPALTAGLLKFLEDILDTEDEDYYETNDELRRVALSIASRTDSVESWCQTVSPQIGGIYPLIVSIRKGAEVIQEHLQLQAIPFQKKRRRLRRRALSLLKNRRRHTFATHTTPSTDTTPPSSSSSASNSALLDEASQACRVLRDLCALSPDLAAVVVDSLLRGAAAQQEQEQQGGRRGVLFHDLSVLLRQQQQHRHKNNDHPTNAAHFGGTNGKAHANHHHARTPSSWMSSSYVSSSSQRSLYVLQLLLAMTMASDHAVQAIRNCEELKQAILACSSYNQHNRETTADSRSPQPPMTSSSSSTTNDTMTTAAAAPLRPRRQVESEICKTANQVLAAIGYVW